MAGLCRRVADPKPQLASVAAGLKKASECGLAGGAPAVFSGFGGGCGAQGGQARRRRQTGHWRGRCTGPRLHVRAGVGQAKAGRSRAGRRRGRASERGRRCCK